MECFGARAPMKLIDLHNVSNHSMMQFIKKEDWIALWLAQLKVVMQIHMTSFLLYFIAINKCV